MEAINKRTLGLLVTIMAIIGGLFAINEVFLTTKNTGPPINEQGAGGFAAIFCSAYFPYSVEDGFQSIATYTKLRDTRRASDNLMEQKVISAQPLIASQLDGNYIQAKVLVSLRSKVKVKGEYNEKLEDVRNTYVVSLRILEGPDGYSVIHYPSLSPYTHPAEAAPSYPPATKEEIGERMKPVISTFCRAFFVSKNTDDIANFFKTGADIPKPLAGKFEYISLDKLEVYGEGVPYLVYATAKVVDKTTGLETNTTLELFITMENQKYVIESMEK